MLFPHSEILVVRTQAGEVRLGYPVLPAASIIFYIEYDDYGSFVPNARDECEDVASVTILTRVRLVDGQLPESILRLVGVLFRLDEISPFVLPETLARFKDAKSPETKAPKEEICPICCEEASKEDAFVACSVARDHVCHASCYARWVMENAPTVKSNRCIRQTDLKCCGTVDLSRIKNIARGWYEQYEHACLTESLQSDSVSAMPHGKLT